ncbi:MAG: double-strand break repair protein AddB [Pseudomonadota bacterium]
MTDCRIFSIDAGVPFLNQLARALCSGDLVEGFTYRPDDPLCLSQATIYVPTRRAARALRSEFVDMLERKSAILPTIRTLGESEDDTGFLEQDQPLLLELAPPVASVERLLELAQLIMLWKRNLPKSVSAFHGDGRLIAPANPADAVWLARGLAEIMDAMETEERPWAALDRLVGDDYAVWWQLTLEFLKIAVTFWPQRLEELKRSDPAAHRNAILLSEAARLAGSPPDSPVIVAGSTGSIPATAMMMKAVASLPMGAVVLPGLDTALEKRIWDLMGGSETASEDPAVCGHPQYGLHRLLQILGADRRDFRKLGRPSSQIDGRNGIVAAALLPAEATADWASQKNDGDDVSKAFENVELIEAANEREEAVAIATALRLAAGEGSPGGTAPRQVALVTPDRNLARRVVVELRRFGIAADDSGGTPLALSAQGSMLQLLLHAVYGAENTAALVGLIKHPLMRLGQSVQAARKAAGILERVALRGGTGDASVAGLAEAFDQSLKRRTEDQRHAPHWQKRLNDQDIVAARRFARHLQAALTPLAGHRHAAISDWARQTAQVLETVACDEDGGLEPLWGDEAGEKLAELFASMMENRSGFSCTASEWLAMIPALIAGELVKPRTGGHPHIFVWGALEARLQQVDTLVLAGLNEGTWPGSPAGNPFLSGSMKTQIGLDPPERRIGLAAHDFQMGMGADHVILSRSARSANAPTVASRWLQRIAAVIGKDQTERLRARGDRYIRWAATLDQHAEMPLASRPEPKPPADMQPKRYSFSEVRTLRRDPYAVYARRILRLDPPEMLVGEPGAAERGTLYHRILERYIRSGPDLCAPDAADRLRTLADIEFRRETLPAHVKLIWRMHFEEIVDAYVQWERDRDAAISRRIPECRARMEVPGCGITLSGIADRIDIGVDGKAEIFDYKTGNSPSRRQAWTLLDPQLSLEGAALRAGAFENLGAFEPSSLAYVRLRPGDRLKVDRIEGAGKAGDDSKTANDLAEQSISRLIDLVDAFAAGRIGFASQLIPESATHYGHDYDHLARVREWSTTGAGEDDGGDM